MIALLIILVVIPLALAGLDVGYNEPATEGYGVNIETEAVTFNNDTGAVNSSDFWDDLNTPADIDLSNINDDSGFYINHTSIVYNLWNSLWSLFLKPEVPSAYLYNDSTTFYFNDTKLNETIDSKSYGKAIYLYNASLSAGTHHIANDTWNTDSARITNIDIVTESIDYNFTLCQNDAMDSNCKVLYANSYKNASSYGSYTYTDEDASQEVHYTIADNEGGNTFNIKFTGVTA